MINKLRKTGIALVILFVIIFILCSCSLQLKDKKIPVKVLILPKFEAGELTGNSRWRLRDLRRSGLRSRASGRST